MSKRFRGVTLLIALHVVVAACSGGNAVAPTPLLDTSAAAVSQPSTFGPLALPEVPPFQSYTVQFTNIGPDRAPVTTTYTEAGFTISPALADWIAFGYGNPGPSMVFYTSSGVTTEGEVTIRTAEGLPLFRFTSVDLYSSVTRIPYVITGTLQGHVMFTEAGTLGNTFGNFVTVSSSQSNIPIDTLVIRLTNALGGTVGGGGTNPMGLDNIVMRR